MFRDEGLPLKALKALPCAGGGPAPCVSMIEIHSASPAEGGENV